MSNSFNNKDYNEYFRSLENRLQSESQRVNVQTSSKPVKRRRRRYRVIRVNSRAVLALFIVVIAVAATVIGVSKFNDDKSSVSAENTKSDVENKQSSESKKVSAFKPRITESTLTLGDDKDAKGIIIINTENGDIVAAKNHKEKLYPSSTTKVMTLLVAVENIKDYNDTFTMTLDITDPLFVEGASVAGFLAGESITMTDMLYGTILPSGADAAVGLAVKIAGSEEAFVKLMNKKADELKLENTHFTNVSGLYNKNHYTTAYDMAIILHAAMQNEICRKILTTYQYTTTVTEQHPQGILLTSTLFSYMYGTEPETATIEGGKTGFVNESGYCIASFGSNNTTKNEYIVVTLGSSSRWPAFYGQIELYKEFVQ